MQLLAGMAEHTLQLQSGGSGVGQGGETSGLGYFPTAPPTTSAPGQDLGSLGLYPPPHQETSSAGGLAPATNGPLYVPTTHASLLQSPVYTQRPGAGVGGWTGTSESHHTAVSYPSYTSPSQSYSGTLPGWGRGEAPGGITDPLHRSAQGLSPFSPYVGTDINTWSNYAGSLSFAAHGQYRGPGMWHLVIKILY